VTRPPPLSPKLSKRYRNRRAKEDEMKKKNKKHSPATSLKIETLKKNILDALRANRGMVATSCQQLGIERSHYYYHTARDPDFRAACESINELNIDTAEMKLWEHIEAGKETPLLFYLRTQGKKRGYVEQREPVDVNAIFIQIQEANKEVKELAESITHDQQE